MALVLISTNLREVLKIKTLLLLLSLLLRIILYPKGQKFGSIILGFNYVSVKKNKSFTHITLNKTYLYKTYLNKILSK